MSMHSFAGTSRRIDFQSRFPREVLLLVVIGGVAQDLLPSVAVVGYVKRIVGINKMGAACIALDVRLGTPVLDDGTNRPHLRDARGRIVTFDKPNYSEVCIMQKQLHGSHGEGPLDRVLRARSARSETTKAVGPQSGCV